jgi:outer membrane lipoprotein LolB
LLNDTLISSVDSTGELLNNPGVRLLPVLLAAFIAGCAAVPERAPLDDPRGAWRARQAALASVDAWEIRGRLALRTADDGFQASLQWRREAERHRIELAGPLGGGRVRLTQDEQGAELRDAKDKVYRDRSLQRLLLRATGWQLPLDGLNYWVLGLPAPTPVTSSDIDAWGRLAVLEQQGWEIRFLDYAHYGAHELPSRVFVKRKTQTAAGATLDVRLVIETWTIPGAPGERR